MSTATIVWDDEAWTDIGGGVEITFQVREDTNERVGLIERHVCAAGGRGLGEVPFAGRGRSGGAAYWTVEQDEPLTLSPSIQCPRCPHHGWIRDGRWVPA